MMNTAQVVKLTNNNVYDEIMSYVNLARHSDNTKKSYETGVRDFFRLIREKDIEHLTWEDLNIKKKDVEHFRTKLKENGASNTTINNKVASLRGLYYDLASNDHKLSIDFFKGIKKLPDDTDSYDVFTTSEVEDLVYYASQERKNGEMKANLIKFAVDTSIRQEAITKLKWTDFEITEDDEVKINAIDKGNVVFKASIHKSFYNDLLKTKTNDEYVFDININTLKSMMPRLIKKLDNTEGRNLSFHSLRKTGITFKYNFTKDIKVAQKAANHKDPSLTIKTYVDDVDYGVLGFYSLQENTTESKLRKLTKDQFNQLLDHLDTDILLRLEKKAKELF